MSAPIERHISEGPIATLPIGGLVYGINGTQTRWRKTGEGMLIKVREPKAEGQQ